MQITNIYGWIFEEGARVRDAMFRDDEGEVVELNPKWNGVRVDWDDHDITWVSANVIEPVEAP